MGSVYVVGTGDTKGRELAYLREVIASQGLPVVVVDVGTTGHASTADITPAQVAAHHPAGADAVVSDDRGAAVGAMAVALEHFAVARVADVAGMIGIGGSGGTAIVAPALRALPIGVPKVLVSTVASGNVAPYVGPADIAMLYSVTDLAGLNRISRVVLGNAANAVAGMVAHPVTPPADARPVVGLTMFGVTTALVTQLVAALEAAWDPLVFHATGTGGQSLEKLVDSGMVGAMLDMTTTEVADLLCGGVFPATEDRLGAVIRTGVPYVGSCGALDMANFGAPDTVPERYSGRRFHVHNPQVTLMRTTPEENAAFGAFLGGAPEPLRGTRALPAAGGRRLRDRRPRPAVPRPRRRRRALRGAGGPGAADRAAAPPARPPPRQRPGVRPGRPGRARGGDLVRQGRAEILERFRGMIERRQPIVGGGAGTGLSAKCEEAGGIDLIVIYNSGRYRMAGRGSLAGLLAYGNANQIVVEMASEVLPVVQHTPVLAGVNGTDPFYLPEVFLPELARLGFAGVQNFPTVGLIDGVFRQNLEETGMGYGLEVAMIRHAATLDLLTTPYVFIPEEAEAMTDAGADLVVCHMGLTTGGAIGAETALTLDDAVERVDRLAAAARSVRPDVIVLCHGGPIAEPADASYVLQRTTGVHGFYGASSMERLPDRAGPDQPNGCLQGGNVLNRVSAAPRTRAPCQSRHLLIGPPPH